MTEYLTYLNYIKAGFFILLAVFAIVGLELLRRKTRTNLKRIANGRSN